MKIFSKKLRITLLGLLCAFIALGIYAVLPVFEPIPDATPLFENQEKHPDGAGTLRLLEIAKKRRARETNESKVVRLDEAIKATFGNGAKPVFTEPPPSPQEADLLAHIKKQHAAGFYENDRDLFLSLDDTIAIEDLKIALGNYLIPWDEVAFQKILPIEDHRELLAVLDEETDFSESTERRLSESPVYAPGVLSTADLVPLYFDIIGIARIQIRADLERGDVPAALTRHCKLNAMMRSRILHANNLITILTATAFLQMIDSIGETFFYGRTPISEETLATLKQEHTENEQTMPDFHNVLRGEFVFVHNALDYYLKATEVKTDPFDPNSPTKKTGWFWRFQCEVMKKDALKTMLSLLPDLKAKTPFEELAAKWKRPDDERLFSFRGIVNVEAPTIFFSRRVGFGCLPEEMIKSAIASVEILENTNSRAKICLACQEFRKARGRFPTSFDELVPAYLKRVPVYRSQPTTSLHFDTKSGKTTKKNTGDTQDRSLRNGSGNLRDFPRKRRPRQRNLRRRRTRKHRRFPPLPPENLKAQNLIRLGREVREGKARRNVWRGGDRFRRGRAGHAPTRAELRRAHDKSESGAPWI